MNVKQTAKKITALVAGGAFLTGLTVSGAAAFEDLSEYPNFFIEDGAFNGYIVVGEQASTSDVIGAIDIAASLQAESVTPVSAGGSVGATIEGAEEFELAFNEAFPNDNTTLDFNDVAGLIDGSIRFDGSNYDVEEQIFLKKDGLEVVTSGANNDEDFGTTPYLTVAQDSVEYRYTFMDDLNVSEVEPGRASTELSLRIMGMDLTVTEFDGDTITVEGAREDFMQPGDTVQVDGYTVTLAVVGESAVIVDVDGERKPVSYNAGESVVEEFDNGNFEVGVTNLFYADNSPDNGATLRLGSELSQTVEIDDALEMFGEDEDDPEWRWTWQYRDASGENVGSYNADDRPFLAYIGAYNDLPRDELDLTDSFQVPALGPGESMFLPNKYAEITMPGLFDSRSSDVNMRFVSDRFVTSRGDSRSNFVREDVLEFSGENSDSFRINGNRASSVFIRGVNTDGEWDLGYDDGNDKLRTTASEFIVANTRDQRNGKDVQVSPVVTLQNESAVSGVTTDGNITVGNNVYEIVAVGFNESFDESDVAIWAKVEFDLGGSDSEALYFRLGQDNADDVSYDGDVDGFGGFDQFGVENRDASSADLIYVNSAGQARTIGTRDYGFLSDYGVSFEDVESQLDSDRFTMTVPYERAEAQVLVRTERSSVSGGSSGSGAYVVNPLGTGIAILDSQANLNNGPHLVVGGPRANTVAAALLDNPSEEEISEMFQPGRAMIRLFSSQNALLVAGYDAEDTLGATYALANYADYDLSGSEVELDVVDASSVTVNPVN